MFCQDLQKHKTNLQPCEPEEAEEERRCERRSSHCSSGGGGDDGGGRGGGGSAVQLVESLLLLLLLCGCTFFGRVKKLSQSEDHSLKKPEDGRCLTFFRPKGGSLHRASRLPRPCWAQVPAWSRLTWRERRTHNNNMRRRRRRRSISLLLLQLTSLPTGLVRSDPLIL